jgi:hypothetical protein
MKPLIIECLDQNWKSLLKRDLQGEIKATLNNFDYTSDASFVNYWPFLIR